MRDYRGKRIDGKGWVYGGYYSLEVFYTVPKGDSIPTDTPRLGHFIQPTYNNPAEEVIPESVGQSIEANDKNGDLVYVGDMFKIGGGIFIVYRSKRRIGFVLASTKSGLKKDIRQIRRLKTIGNVIDNPELSK